MSDDDQGTGTSLEAIAEVFVGPMKRWAARMERSGIDPHRTATMFDRFEQDLDRTFGGPDVGPMLKRVVDEVRRLAGTEAIDIEDMIDDRPDDLTSREHMFCDFHRPNEQQYPFVTGVLLGGVGFLGRPFLESWLRASGYLEAARKARREARNELLRAAALPLIDELYYAFVDSLYAAECVRRGRPIRVERGSRQLALVDSWATSAWPNIVDPSASMIRNAAAHPSRRWKYRPREDAVELFDRNPDRPSLRLSNRELMARMVSMRDDVGAMFTISRTITVPSMLRLMHACGGFEVFLGRRPPDGFDSALFNRTIEPTGRMLQRLGWRDGGEHSAGAAQAGRRPRRATSGQR